VLGGGVSGGKYTVVVVVMAVAAVAAVADCIRNVFC